MKKNILIIGLLFANIIIAQQILTVKKSLFKINVLTPSLVYEYGFNDKITLYSELSLGFLYNYNATFGSSSAFNLNINEQFRYYYNFEKRLKNNKKTNCNSANYLALTAINSFKPFAGKNLDKFYFENNFVIGPVWGLQRTYGGNFNLDLNLGLGAKIAQNNKNPIIPIINFTLGWVIFDK